MKSKGGTLFADLARGEMVPGQLRIWWQGQISYALRGTAGTALIDPFLAPMEARQVPPQFSLGDIGALDLILVTHEHIDHFDPDFIEAALKRFDALLVVMPLPLAQAFAAATTFSDRVIGAQPGEKIACGGFAVHPIPALHGLSMKDAYSYGRESANGLTRYLGYVVDMGGVTVYHSGDTLADDEQIAALQKVPLPIDVALLPINGRDYFREKENLIGNMDPSEAARLAEIIRADLVIPGHYDMFAGNPGYPGHFVDLISRLHPDLHAAVLSKKRVFNYCAPVR